MINVPRLVAGLLVSTLIGYIAYRRHSLTRSGWLGAIITGSATFGFGGWAWGSTLIAFFISSSLLSRYKQQQKQQIAGEKFEKGGERDLWQALANGGIGAALAFLYGFVGADAILAMFAGVMATVTADTWATELGVLSRTQPRLITTLQPAAPGTSGAVTLLGLLASLAGSLFIGLCLLLGWRLEYGVWAVWLLAAAGLGGLAGSLFDSLLGATIQAMYRNDQGDQTERGQGRDGQPYDHMAGWRWVNNDTVNLVSSFLGGICALIVVLVV
ncbi:MAG: DUF92 domain-containing protein [Roseiflexaceae bacterium]|nr:DUF92 domain-containing protein [Roseiflexaceae bacterium]